MDKDFIAQLISELKNTYKENIIAIYGIGSYFDPSLPEDWSTNDIDLIVIVDSLDLIPKKDWTNVRYEKKILNGYDIWIGFNSLEAYSSKENFKKQSFTNYKWSLLELKYPENSQLLGGQDIRSELPDISSVNYDYDDILARVLYHLDKSIQEDISKNQNASKHQFTKAIFKLGFYLAVFFDSNFHSTSISSNMQEINKLVVQGKIDKKLLEVLKMSMEYRRDHQPFKENFTKFRNKFIIYLFSQLATEKFHRKFTFNELIRILENSFSGFPNLLKLVKQVKAYYSTEKKIKKEQIFCNKHIQNKLPFKCRSAEFFLDLLSLEEKKTENIKIMLKESEKLPAALGGYHGNYRGGLFDHILLVTNISYVLHEHPDILSEYREFLDQYHVPYSNNYKDLDLKQVVKSCLIHDMGKVSYYSFRKRLQVRKIYSSKFEKDSINHQIKEIFGFDGKDLHVDETLAVLKRYGIAIDKEIYRAIIFHHGRWSKYKPFKPNKLGEFLHVCDMIASHLYKI
jgi:hypothetical protein